ncbi:DUF6069 family protein [Actinoplanes sp. CA-030573]|uniref:DUF6069 family protein n=1 Tax=Actinoplanes sp. CA-030573 TaxID=3239898 RepID=UPI003D921399
MLGALLCYQIAHATGEQLEVGVRGADRPVPWQAVVLATLVGAVAGWGLARLSLGTGRPRRTFLLLTAAGLVISAAPPAQAATSSSTAVWLLVMHAAVAAAIIPALAATLPATAGPRAGDLMPTQ